MPKSIKNHPYIIGFIIAALILFLVGVFALDFSWSESLLASVVFSAVGTGSIWWKLEGFG
jgi:hypothetical protein